MKQAIKVLLDDHPLRWSKKIEEQVVAGEEGALPRAGQLTPRGREV